MIYKSPKILGRQLMLLKNTARPYQFILKILAKRPVLSMVLSSSIGIASVSQPSLIILIAPKHEAKFFSKSLFSAILFVSALLRLGPKKFAKYYLMKM